MFVALAFGAACGMIYQKRQHRKMMKQVGDREDCIQDIFPLSSADALIAAANERAARAEAEASALARELAEERAA
jgi:hypothetical protein